MVTPTTLQAEILEVLYTALGEETFTASQGYNAVKSKLPLNAIVQSPRDLGALLNACNLKPVGDVQVERAGYDGHKKVVKWKLAYKVPTTSLVSSTLVPAQSVTLPVLPASIDTIPRLHPRVLQVRTVISAYEEAFNRPIHPDSYKKSFDMAMWWLERTSWNTERVVLAIENATTSDRPLTTMALELSAL